MRVKPLEILEIPRMIIFGPNALDRFIEMSNNVFSPQDKVLVVTGRSHSRRYAEALASSLKSSVEVLPVDKSVDVVNLVDEFNNLKYDFVVGVGGGRALDVAKIASYIIGARFIAVPTTASNDGIASPYISFTLQYDLFKIGLGEVRVVPEYVVADTLIVLSSPRRLTVAGLGDLIGKLTAVKDWELAHRLRGEEYSEYAARLSMSSFEIIVRNSGRIASSLDEESIRVIIKALIGCGVAMSIAGTSRPCSGSEHLFAHAVELLSKDYNLNPPLHGEVVSLGSIIMSYLHGINWVKLKRISSSLGLPTRLSQVGVDRDLAVQALLTAHKLRPERYTILGSEGLTRQAAERVLEETDII